VRNPIFVLAFAGLIVTGGVISGHAQSSHTIPKAGLFIGLGGSYNTVGFGTQDIYAIGTSSVYQGGTLSSTGSAEGPAQVYLNSESGLGFSMQGGYFQKFPGGDWLWGAKFAYSYLGATSTVRNALLPQAGSFTAVGSTTPVPFTGNAVVRSYQNQIVQQLAFVPLVGRSFEKSFLYIGAGPTLSQVRTDLNGVIGFADINGVRTDVSGTPIDLSSSGWVYGGTAMVGATYFFDQSWFLDVSYSVAMTANQTSYYFSPFTNPNGTNGSTVIGTLVGNSSGRVVTQGITVTLNKAL
jgi:hypothetical protein